VKEDKTVLLYHESPKSPPKELLLTVEFEDDLGSGLSWGKPTFLVCNAAASKKYCGLTCCRVLFSVLFYVVRVVHRFVFWLAIKETPNKWRPLFVKKSCNDKDSCF
jgi:hypothetical protein